MSKVNTYIDINKEKARHRSRIDETRRTKANRIRKCNNDTYSWLRGGYYHETERIVDVLRSPDGGIIKTVPVSILRKYCLMEEYLFNYIDAECDLLINMYEEEFADQKVLPSILEITERMINSSDNEEFIKLANEFKGLVEKAIEFNTCIGFFF